MKGVIFTFVVLFGIVAAKHEIYKGYEVYKVKIDTEPQLRQFHDYETRHDLDVFGHPVLGEQEAEVIVTPDQKEEFLDFLQELGVEFELKIEDVMAYFQERDAEMNAWRSQRSGRLHPFENYPRHAEVNEYLDHIAAEYPDLVTLVQPGVSHDGRDIKYIKISTTNFEDTTKPIVFLDGMIHAREWVTTPTLLYTIHKLVVDRDPEDADLLENIDWIILPIVNPDGYEWTHTDERLWRRTRSVHNPEQECLGIDGNRNFDFEFNTIGVSANPCAQTFPGTAAFSEVETAIVHDILHEFLDRIQMYINVHSHGNWVLFGYGTGENPPNVRELHAVGAAMGEAMDTMKLPEATFYRVGNSAHLLYGTSGSAQDYAQYIGVPFSYTYELPGYGFMFQVPPQYINHVNAETYHGYRTGARLSVLYYRNRLNAQ